MTPRDCSQPCNPSAATWAPALSVNMKRNAKNRFRRSYCQISCQGHAGATHHGTQREKKLSIVSCCRSTILGGLSPQAQPEKGRAKKNAAHKEREKKKRSPQGARKKKRSPQGARKKNAAHKERGKKKRSPKRARKRKKGNKKKTKADNCAETAIVQEQRQQQRAESTARSTCQVNLPGQPARQPAR